MKDVIDIKEFSRMPKGKGENKILSFFKENPKKAFKGKLIIKKTGYSKGRVYKALANLIYAGLIEKKGEYYALKQSLE